MSCTRGNLPEEPPFIRPWYRVGNFARRGPAGAPVQQRGGGRRRPGDFKFWGFTDPPGTPDEGNADINFIGDSPERWVLEPQLNYQLNRHAALLVEFRYNGFEAASPRARGTGVAAGMRISF